jgi:hypothetical protein
MKKSKSLYHGHCSKQCGLQGFHGDIVVIFKRSRRAAARSMNALKTANYWEVGWRAVEFEQGAVGPGASDAGAVTLECRRHNSE